VWNSHGDKLMRLPPGFTAIGRTENSPFAAIEDYRRNFYGIQFHPEVFHTERGIDVIRNFLSGSAARGRTGRPGTSSSTRWGRSARPWASRVILGLSGGVDSSVAAALIHKADRPPAHMRVRRQRPAQEGRARDGGVALQEEFQDRPAGGGRVGRVSAAPQGRRGAREEAQDHRPDLHRGVREVAQEDRARRTFSPRGRFIPTSSRASRSATTRPRSSRATTTSAACRPDEAQADRAAAGSCSRTRSGGWGPPLACRARWSGASPSPGPGLGVRVIGPDHGGQPRDPPVGPTRSSRRR
jgi:hypothetical protein